MMMGKEAKDDLRRYLAAYSQMLDERGCPASSDIARLLDWDDDRLSRAEANACRGDHIQPMVEAWRARTQPLPTVSQQRSSIPRRLRAAVWAMTDGRCVYCGMQTNPFQDFHVDHSVPRARGGTDDLSNLMPSCARCNLSKGTGAAPK